MEVQFCDLCTEAVPHDDIARGHAFIKAGRVVCSACNVAMGGLELGIPGQAPGAGSTPSVASALLQGSHSDPQPAPADSYGALPGAARRRPLLSPGVGIAVGMSSIILTLVAVIALLVRIEGISRSWNLRHAQQEQRISNLQTREAGTRDGMIARAQKVSEDVMRREVERLDRLERQIGELRLALAAGGDIESGREFQATGAMDASLLTMGDAMERVKELEEQVLFLQAHVFDLLESGVAEAVPTQLDASAPPPLPPGSVGDLVAQLSDEDPIERVEALYALATVSDPGIVRHLTPLLEDIDAYVRALTARLLERLGARSAVQPLINCLEDSDPRVRECAVSALRSITAEEFRFDPLASRAARGDALRRWRSWWTDNWKEFLYEQE